MLLSAVDKFISVKVNNPYQGPSLPSQVPQLFHSCPSYYNKKWAQLILLSLRPHDIDTLISSVENDATKVLSINVEQWASKVFVMVAVEAAVCLSCRRWTSLRSDKTLHFHQERRREGREEWMRREGRALQRTDIITLLFHLSCSYKITIILLTYINITLLCHEICWRS